MRRVRWVIVMILLGAIANVAASWAIVLWFNPAESDWELVLWVPHANATDANPSNEWEHVQIGTALGAHYRAMWIQPTREPGVGMAHDPPAPPLPHWVNVEYAPVVKSKSFNRTIRVQAVGWPLHSMWSAAIHDVSRNAGPSAEEMTVYGIRVRPPSSMPRTLPGWPPVKLLPTRMLWLEFAINTMVYALGLWLIYWVPLQVQRRWRSWRGLCPACAYPVGKSDVCTECGERVVASRGRC